MDFSIGALLTEEVPKPPRIVVYGVDGVGKSTFAAGAPDPAFIQTEDGLAALNVARFPKCKTFDEVLGWIGVLAEQDHSRRTAVLDTLDWCERLIWARVAQDNGVKSIEDIGYGKGYKFALDYWRQLLDAFDYLRNERSMQVVLLAHCKIKRFDDPLADPYDRYQLDLHDGAASIVAEWCDVLGFANYRISTVKTDVGFNQKVTRAVGGGERVIYTQERPGWHAKSRWRLPDTLKLDYPTFDAAITAAMSPPPALTQAA